MRFAITVCDRFEGVLNAFLQAGWQPLKIFIVPDNNGTTGSTSVLSSAKRLGVDVQLSRLRDRHLRELADRGCEALIVASYDWRIPDWQLYLNYAVNFHPSPLPIGRGPYPLVRALLEGHKEWGISCHQLVQEFDSGPVLDRELFPLDERDCHESLSLKVQLAGRRLATRVAENFVEKWTQATPQGEGSYWPRSGDQQRTLDFTRPVEELLRQMRAYGLIECLATVNGTRLYVRRVVGWVEAHDYPVGRLVHSCGRSLVVAVPDGLVAIVEWSLIAAEDMGRLGR